MYVLVYIFIKVPDISGAYGTNLCVNTAFQHKKCGIKKKKITPSGKRSRFQA